MRKEFRNLLPLDEARSIVFGKLPLTESESVPLEAAFGRILAEKVVSSVEVPGFDRASMDGYALRAEDTLEAREDQAVSLDLVGQVPMGTNPVLEVAPGKVAEVSTGSMMPPGANAVVMVEHSEIDGDTLLVRRPVHIGENVHLAGSDIAFGEIVLLPGVRLTAREIGLLAAVGMREILTKELKVGVASTGDELVFPGDDLKPGQIYDINTYSVASAVKECGGSPRIYGILPDDHDEMTEGLKRMAEGSNLILVSGSTSAGVGDMIYRVLEELGEVVFHGVNLKPGKPTLFGTILGKPFFGLPGYPTSALTVFGQLVAPLIRTSLGTEQHGVISRGKLARPIRSEGRRQMLSVGTVGGWVYPVDKGSGSITTLAQADGVIDIPAEVEYLDQGEEVEVHLFGESSEPALLIMGENCPELEILAELLPFPIRVVSVGSRRGVISVQDGVADLAAISISEGLDSTWVCEPPMKGYTRELVLMAQDSDHLDLDRIKERRVMGWARYTEMSRIFLNLLKEKGILAPKFAGQAKTHSVVAAAVEAGRADIGFGVRSVAEDAKLHFTKVAEDEIYFLINPQRKHRKPVQMFLKALKSEEFRSQLPEGVKLSSSSGQIPKR